MVLHVETEINEQEIKVEVMEVNADGKPVGTGQFETLEADALILANGQPCFRRCSLLQTKEDFHLLFKQSSLVPGV